MTLRTLLAGLAAIPLLAGCDALTSVDTRLERAAAAIDNGDFGTASVELRKAVDEEPGNAAVRLLLARLALRASDGLAAAAELERARAAGADPLVVDTLLLDAWLAQGDKAGEVLGYFDRQDARVAQPERGVARGRALLQKADAAAALRAFDEALAQDPKSARARAGRAEALVALGREAEATAELKAALEADPRFWQGAVLQAALIGRRDPTTALALARQSLDNMGSQSTIQDRARGLVTLIDASLSLGKVEDAASAQAELAKMLPDTPLAQLAAARVSLARGNLGEGAGQLQRLLAQAPNLSYARLLLGAALLSQGNLQQAQAQLQQVVDAEPANVEAAKLLADVRLRLDDADGAIEALVPALSSGVPDAQTLALIGQAQAKAGDDPRALAVLERAQGEAAGNPNLRFALAQTRLAAGRAEEALKLLPADQVVGDSTRYFAVRLAALLAARGPAAAQAEAKALQEARPQDTGVATAVASLFASTGDLDQAKAALARALKANEQAVPTLNALAGLEAATGRTTEARDLLQRSLAADPSNVPVRVALATVQSRLGANDEALKVLETDAKAADPTGQLQFARARIELSRGRIKEAEAALDAAIASRPGAERTAEAGRILLEARQYEPALARFRKAVELAPNVAALHAEVARAELALGHLDPARAAAEQALKLQPTNTAAVAVLTTLDLRTGKPDVAQTRIDALAKARPGDLQVNLLRADTLLAAKRPAEAARIYREAAQQRPDAILAVREYQALRAAGDPAALAPLEAWLAKAPRDNRVRAVLAEHHLGAGDNRRAVTEYERMVQVQPGNAAVLNNLAWSYQQVGDPRALATAEKAWNVATGNPSIADTYGSILLEKGEGAKALPLLETAAKGLPNDADVQIRYASALLESGRRPDALQVLREVSVAKDASAKARATADQLLAKEGK